MGVGLARLMTVASGLLVLIACSADDHESSSHDTESLCSIAVALDQCSADAVAVMPDDFEADPCLVYHPGQHMTRDDGDPSTCEGQRPADCEAEWWEVAPPPSRVARIVDGACAFDDECDVALDCVVMAASCCTCAEVYPRALVQQWHHEDPARFDGISIAMAAIWIPQR